MPEGVKMGLREQLMDDLKQAMRQQDERRKVAIRSIISALQYAETELGSDGQRVTLKDDDILALIAKQARQREESIIEFRKGRREDLVAAEEAELVILRAYLPQQMTREEIEAEVRQVIAEIGDGGPKDIGTVMKPLMARLKGRADGRLVNQIVREQLAG
jgi:hypothetical protein